MNYTDRFFEFTVRVHDGFSLRKAINQEERDLELMPDQAEPIESYWIEGVAAVLVENILGYNEAFSKAQSVDDVARDGFDLLIVETKFQGDFVCTWNKEKFKTKLNEFKRKLDEAEKKEWEEKNKPVTTSILSSVPLNVIYGTSTTTATGNTPSSDKG